MEFLQVRLITMQVYSITRAYENVQNSYSKEKHLLRMNAVLRALGQRWRARVKVQFFPNFLIFRATLQISFS